MEEPLSPAQPVSFGPRGESTCHTPWRTLTVADMKTTLGERIRELREAADMSLRELSREVNVSAAFMSDIELGKRYPSDDVLEKIARSLGTTSEALDEYDTRPPLDEMKRKSHTNPAYGFALRRMVEEDVSSEELLKMLDRLKKNRGAE